MKNELLALACELVSHTIVHSVQLPLVVAMHRAYIWETNSMVMKMLSQRCYCKAKIKELRLPAARCLQRLFPSCHLEPDILPTCVSPSLCTISILRRNLCRLVHEWCSTWSNIEFCDVWSHWNGTSWPGAAGFFASSQPYASTNLVQLQWCLPENGLISRSTSKTI